MGQIRDDFGQICIEARRESFVIHASYGLQPRGTELRSVMPGQYFRYGDNDFNRDPAEVFKAHSIDERWLYSAPHDEDGTVDPRYTHQRAEGTIVIVCDEHGHPEDVEDNPNDPLGRVWLEHPHPEFDNHDLDDLLAALQDYRSSL